MHKCIGRTEKQGILEDKRKNCRFAFEGKTVYDFYVNRNVINGYFFQVSSEFFHFEKKELLKAEYCQESDISFSYLCLGQTGAAEDFGGVEKMSGKRSLHMTGREV